MKLCSKCDVELPLKRVQLGYVDCVKCSDVESYGFVNIINHKTYSAPSLAQIGSPKLFEKVGEEAMYLLENNGFDTASLYIDKEVEKYNISSSQAFRLRQIMQVFAQ